MSHTVITHVGVSALSCEAIRSWQSQTYEDIARQLAEGTERPDALEIAQRDLLRGLGRFWGRSMPAHQQRKVSPAEIAALSLLQTEPRPDDNPPLPIDRLVLLRSDTRGGEFCAHLLHHAFLDPDGDIPPRPGYPRLKGEQIEIVRIPGLSVTDERTPDPASSEQDFVRHGLTNYVGAVYKEYDALKEGDTLTLNITSGYKGLVPTARDMSLLLDAYSRNKKRHIDVRLCYLFTDNDKLIFYPALPMMLSFQAFPKLSVLNAAGQPDGIPVSQIAEEPPALFTIEKGVARLSPLGEVVLALFVRIDYFMLLGSKDEQIRAMQLELEQYRKNYRRLAQQVAHHGGEMNASMSLLNDMDSHQKKIAELKTKLTDMGAVFNDMHDD